METEDYQSPKKKGGVASVKREESDAESSNEDKMVFEGEEKEENNGVADDDEEEEEETYREPIVDGRNITFKTRILNQFLACPLCSGYFRDATTIRECLHVFCKSCIIKYFQDHTDCPICKVQLGPYPHTQVKFDRQIQVLLEKILPGVVKEDNESEVEFYAARGIKIVQPKPKKSEETITEEEKNLRKADSMKRIYADEISFELSREEEETDQMVSKLEKPYIRTSAKVTVKHLKKYLVKKLQAPDLIETLDLTYRGESLGNEHSLEYILKTRGIEPTVKNPIFKYRVRREDQMFY